jgi:hypothetical protein
MSFAEFTSNKNKGVLWGLLQEGGVFDNIPASMFQNVKNIFETSILSMKREFNIFFDKNDEGDDEYDKKAAEMIINSNKSVIKKVIDEVNRIKMHNENITKQSQQIRVAQAQAQAQQNSLPLHLKPITLAPTPTPIPASTKKPKIEEIYRADDIKKTRMSELEIRLKEKQAEMDNMLNNKKPEHIDFSDKALGKNRESDLYDKKLAGDEMERLLAETLASRERELEKLNINVGSFSKGVSGGAEIPVNKIVTKRLRESKNVTFNDEDNTKMEYEKQEQEQEQENGNGNQEDENNNTNEENELSFFSKLKLKMGKSTPLDDIMNNANRSDDEGEDEDDEEEKEIMQLRVQEIGNFSGSRQTRETREAGEMQQMREMQRYIILEQRIKVIHDDLNEIKKNQGLILSLLEKKMQ